MGSSSESAKEYDYSIKILLLGDSGVGKSSVLASFISDEFKAIDVTIGMDLKTKLLTVGGKKLKLTIWDTAGQERYRSLPSSYYRGAHGIILVYDVTKRETFTNLVRVWVNEMKLYSTNEKYVKIIVGNKIDKENEREVTTEEGIATAQVNGCLFLECSAKTGVNVGECFEQLASKILEVPSLLEEGKSNTQTLTQKEEGKPSGASPSGASASGGGCC